MIDPDIKPLGSQGNGLEKWWNKMYLFDDNIVTQGEKMFFDIDAIIQKNIDVIANYDP